MADRAPAQRASAGVNAQVCRGEILAALARVLDRGLAPQMPHHARVAVLAARVASHLRTVDRIDAFYAGLIHDIGLLWEQRDPALTVNQAEQANRPLIRAHPLTGAQMAATVPELASVAETILDHHEWFNGHGYPRGKAGDEISHAAQVLRFADTCDIVLREQGSPELLSFLDAVRKRTALEVAPLVADAGVEVLGEPDFYAQLLTAPDVGFLVESTLRRLAATDFAETETEITALLELFATVTDAHASDKVGHSRRVASLAVMVALALGLGPEQQARIRWAALLHDVGVITVPKALLDQPRLLSPEEVAEVRRQVSRVEELLAPVSGLEDVIHAAACHAEAFDGSGCPAGLEGTDIPLGARIITICDTFDALTSRRPYREARDTALAVDILLRGSGSLFDPDVVAAAIPVFLISQSAEDVHAAVG